MKPITPAEAQEFKNKNIPKEVIEAFNEIIAENFTGTYSKFKQKDVVALIKKKTSEWKDAWLDVEPLFEQHGWKVKYDKPGYNEEGDATFEFRKLAPGEGSRITRERND